MATQSLVEQVVIFVAPDTDINVSGIMSNSLIQSLASNSAGQNLITSVQGFQHWTGTAWVAHSFFEIKCYVSSTFQATIQSNISNLQAAFPTYLIFTWGYPVTFGN
jgi:hypothetical protein